MIRGCSTIPKTGKRRNNLLTSRVPDDPRSGLVHVLGRFLLEPFLGFAFWCVLVSHAVTLRRSCWGSSPCGFQTATIADSFASSDWSRIFVTLRVPALCAARS